MCPFLPLRKPLRPDYWGKSGKISIKFYQTYWSNSRKKSIQFQLTSSQQVMGKCRHTVNALHEKLNKS